MSDSEADDPVPKQLLNIPTEYQSTIPKTPAPQSLPQSTMSTKTPSLFDSITTELQFRRRVIEMVSCYDGDPDTLSTWLRDTGLFFAKECVPDAHQVFAIRFLLTDQALDIYSAHEDLVHNFNDLRKLLLQAAGKTPLRTLASLDSISNLTFSLTQPVADSTRLDPQLTTNTSLPTTSITFTQSADDLTQNEYRKAIITQFHADKSLKFSGDHNQDVIKWLEKLERKFEIAEISDAKKFDYLTELLDKGALTWFIERKASFKRSWSDFVDHFKKVYDSPSRSQIAYQKLQNYHQSTDQDIRSFCSTIRKLCKEYDHEMSKKMKLDFLFRSVNPTYRPEILKLKPTDADEFEQRAIEVENTFLQLQAYELLNPSTVTTYTSPAQSDYNVFYPQQSSSSYYTRQPNRFRSNQRQYSQKPSRPMASSQRNQQSSTSAMSAQQPHNLFAYTSTTSGTSADQQSIPPLMPPSQSPSQSPPTFHHPNQQHHSLNLSSPSPSNCQWCFQPGHSSWDCPF